MPLLKRATEQTQSEWAPTPEGLWRWMLEKPDLFLSPQYGKWNVRFPMKLTPTEQERLKAEYPAPPEDVMQSWTSSYMPRLSLGYMKDGAYVSTKLIDFLAACLGSTNIKNFRAWVSRGGGPGRPEDKDDDKAEMEMIREWLGWWEGLEVYGSIRHEPDKKNPAQVWGRFGGPLPVGSLPGQADPDYQAHGRGKLRAMLLEAGVDVPEDKPASVVTRRAAAPVAEVDREPPPIEEEPDELPF